MVRDLKMEVFSAKPVVKENKPVIDLKKDDFGERFEAKPT